MAVQGLLCFHADRGTFCSGSVKDAIDSDCTESVDSIQSEVSQEEEKQISHVKAHIWNLEKWY